MTQWGDGSGTGTGGTIHVLSQARPIQAGLMWMGMWGSGGPATSNRREAYTVVEGLEVALESMGPSALQGRYIFVFTDNDTTYNIVSSGTSSEPALLSILRRLKSLQARWKFILEVIHVPGDVMILQGTDGLSRGLWIQGHYADTMEDLFRELLAPAQPLPALLNEVLRRRS